MGWSLVIVVVGVVLVMAGIVWVVVMVDVVMVVVLSVSYRRARVEGV